MAIGGVRNDIPSNFTDKCRKYMKLVRDQIQAYEKGCDKSKIFQIRTYDLGKISRSKAMNLGITGPPLRGSNCDYDIRRDQPYEIYDELSDWQPVKEKGDDVFARHRVRMREMEESVLIVEEALKKMPKGDVRVKPPRRIPAGDAMVSCEDPRGESMMYIISDGSDKPYRWKIRSPIFITVSAMPHMLRGYKVADVPSIMGSVDMCIGECDK
jgi:NADH-quinone oxidoreductase subunit D